MIVKAINDVIAYEANEDEVLVLTEEETKSELIKYSFDFTVLWKQSNEKSYDFFSFGNHIYVTTKEGRPRSLVFNKDNGKFLRELNDLVLHLPILYKSPTIVVALVGIQNEDTIVSLDENMIVISKLNPDGLKVSKVVDENCFISFEKGVLSFVEFSTSKAFWQIDLFQLVPSISKESRNKLRLWGCLSFDNRCIVSVFDLKNNNQYLIGINSSSGKTEWLQKNNLHVGGDNNYLYSLSYDGIFKIINPQTGTIIFRKDISSSFLGQDINCDRGLSFQKGSYIFKDNLRKKIGIINSTSLELRHVCSIPENAVMSANDYPRKIGNRLFIHSQIQRKLYVLELQG